MTEPDFDKWAVALWSNHGPRCTDVREALKQAFEQGYQLGLTQGWAIEQDEDSSAIRQTLDNLKKAFPNGFHNPED